MPIRLTNIRMPIDVPEQALAARAAAALNVPPAEIARWRILRKSLDARNKSHIEYVYSLEVAAGDGADETQLLGRASRGVKAQGIAAELYREPPFEMPAAGNEPLPERPTTPWPSATPHTKKASGWSRGSSSSTPGRSTR